MEWSISPAGINILSYKGKEYRLSGKTIGRALSGGYLPDMEELEEWMFDSVCETPTGNDVEPDGYGPDGVPSWLLLLGLI